MKKLYFVFVLLLFSFSSCLNSPPPPKALVIEMYSPDLPDTSTVFITGSMEALGNWNPSAIKMRPLKNHRWRYCIQGKIPSMIEYKFTLGSWDREAGGANGLPLQNFILKPKGDTLVEHPIYFWLNGVRKVFKGSVTGHVDYPRKMKANGLLDREIVVWFPPEYDQNTSKRFPVLYMHDGQNLFNPATSSFGVDWQIDETLDSLAKTGTCDIPIVVGIYNTAERTADYTMGKQSDAYMKFVVDSVKAFVDKNYRTLPDAEHTAVGGSSHGGLISFRMAWEYPQVFSKAFCLSPALKIQNIDYVQNVLDYNGSPKNLKFYIDNGGVGLDEQLLSGNKEMLDALKKKGYKPNKDYFWVYDKTARHFESDWAKRMPHAFELMYTKNKTNAGK